ncbi:hypothetical protein [Methylobacterium durans]|uniref:Uncharacterized protein n=1 Tax=Methylobacterium durans TaxID=2202825 RepID=A0A2U8WAC0_9HYPH|nr:hypothetical protein [Methylobacterium durans]AWN43113.1 hypothetical protein DK389_24745 [Methylobacterium durans]
MELEALERPADLQIWHVVPAPAASRRKRFGSLRDAIAAAAETLSAPGVEPWIVTDEGELLSPTWIQTYLN